MVFWDEHVKAAEAFGKGNQVTIEGMLTHRSYVDKENIIRYSIEIVVHSITDAKTKKEA